MLYDAHYGWKDPTRRQLAERAQLAGLRLEPMIEIEHVEAALKLVAAGVGDTIVSGAVIASDAFPPGLHTAPFAEPLYDTIALAQHRGRPLSNATREFARLAEDTIRDCASCPNQGRRGWRAADRPRRSDCNVRPIRVTLWFMQESPI